jgi:hypothetical protein
MIAATTRANVRSGRFLRRFLRLVARRRLWILWLWDGLAFAKLFSHLPQHELIQVAR